MNLSADTLSRWVDTLDRHRSALASLEDLDLDQFVAEVREAWLRAVREETAASRPNRAHVYHTAAGCSPCHCPWEADHGDSSGCAGVGACAPDDTAPPSAPATTIDLGADHLDEGDEPAAGDVVLVADPARGGEVSPRRVADLGERDIVVKGAPVSRARRA